MSTSTDPQLDIQENNHMPISSGYSFSNLKRLAVAVLLLSTVLPAGAQDEPQGKEGLVVTYLVFSGLPNPTFNLTEPSQVADLQGRIASVQEAGARIEGEGPEPVLGYNGIMIEDLAATAEDDTFYVIKGDVLRVDGGNPEDPAARFTLVSGDALEIESLLISLGAEQGIIDKETLAAIQGLQ